MEDPKDQVEAVVIHLLLPRLARLELCLVIPSHVEVG